MDTRFRPVFPKISFASKPSSLPGTLHACFLCLFLMALWFGPRTVPCIYRSASWRLMERCSRNSSCQQASLSLPFCMHVLYVFPDRLPRRAKGFGSLYASACGRPWSTGRTGGARYLLAASTACPSIVQAFGSIGFTTQSQTAVSAGLYTVCATNACRGQALRPRAPSMLLACAAAIGSAGSTADASATAAAVESAAAASGRSRRKRVHIPAAGEGPSAERGVGEAEHEVVGQHRGKRSAAVA